MRPKGANFSTPIINFEAEGRFKLIIVNEGPLGPETAGSAFEVLSLCQLSLSIKKEKVGSYNTRVYIREEY